MKYYILFIFLLGFILYIPNSYAVTSFVQKTENSFNNVTTFTSNVTSGNLLIVYAVNGQGNNITGISDSLGNTWTLQYSFEYSGVNPDSYMWVAETSSSGSDSITLNVISSANLYTNIMEISGGDINDITVRTNSTSAPQCAVTYFTPVNGSFIVSGCKAGLGVSWNPAISPYTLWHSNGAWWENGIYKENWNASSTDARMTFGGGSFGINYIVLEIGSETIIPVSTLEGKLCGNMTSVETNSNITQLPKLISVMCIGDFQTGAIINRTGFVIHNYTNQFMSAWATLSIYMGDDGQVISHEHPLKLVWQKTYEVRNNTNNQVVEWYPNLFIPDHNFVALAFSSTEDIGMNTTVNPNTQYTVNQYAPSTVSFLQSSDYKVMMYAYWYRQNVTFAGDNTFSAQTTAFIPIPSAIQAFWISIGIPPAAGGIIMLIAGIIILSIIVLVKGVDEPEKVIGILGVTAILSASAANLIPVEFGIGVMVFIAAFFAAKIYGRIAGGSEA